MAAKSKTGKMRKHDMTKKTSTYWYICNGVSVLLCIGLVMLVAHYLIQTGYVRDEFGLTGPAPFYAGTGLSLAFFLPIIVGIASFFMMLATPGGRVARVGSVVISIAIVSLLLFCLVVVVQTSAYHNVITSGIYR